MCLKTFLLRFPAVTPAFSKRIGLLVAAVLLLAAALPGQSRKELEDKRKSLMQEIARTSNELKSTQRDQKAAFQVVVTLQRQIRSRQQLVKNLQAEVAGADSSIVQTYQTLQMLEGDLRQLRSEYSRMLRSALRQKLTNSPMMFLLSASSMNEAFRRWQYLRQYDRYRIRQARRILETERALEQKALQLIRSRDEKENMLASIQQQQVSLNQELGEKDKLLRSLKDNERKLASELSRQEEAHQRLNQTIESIIRQEMLAMRRKSRSPEALSGAPETGGAKSSASASGFGGSKGRLPWPVNDGEIVRQFGARQHPKYKDVQTQSNGIDIRSGSSSVRAVYEGRVAGIQYIPGYQNTVILQHGDYYTVYSNLSEVLVKRGDAVSNSQEIGRLSSDKPELHFELWREKSRLNPETWIMKR